jgi:hypothetical protein
VRQRRTLGLFLGGQYRQPGQVKLHAKGGPGPHDGPPFRSGGTGSGLYDMSMIWRT